MLLVMLPMVSGAATLKGKTTIQSEAAAGMEVFAYPIKTLDFSGPAQPG